jgi:hypothetical protein
MSPRSPLAHANVCACQHQHGIMRLRYDRTYPRCPIAKRYSPYRQRPAQVRHAGIVIPWNTARGRALFGLPLVPLEIQGMIVQEATRDPDASLQDLASYLRVCRSWYDPVKVAIEERQHEIIRKRLDDQNSSLGVLCTYFRFRRGWDQIVRKVILDDTELRARMVHDAVRGNNIEAARILFGECGVDAKETFVRDVEGSLDTISRTAMQTACYYGYAEMIRLLVDEFGALEGKCKLYIRNLILVAVDRGNADAWFMLDRYMDRAPE